MAVALYRELIKFMAGMTFIAGLIYPAMAAALYLELIKFMAAA
jgi:hypothetical protein